jgi:hypothetical protein
VTKPSISNNRPIPRPAGIGIRDKGIAAIKQALTNNRPNARIGGRIGGGLRRTVREKYNGFQTSIYVYRFLMALPPKPRDHMNSASDIT